MLHRYGLSSKGKKKQIAIIYTRDEHKIDNNKILNEVFKIIRKLKNRGYEAYIVGGAVRDLMVGKKPKDFDIATDALPQQIRRLFSNSRIIGKRFKLVHIYYEKMIFEVSTFRSPQSDNFVNHYGSIEDDVFRRDFTINALYYCPLREWVFDYIGGVDDIKKKRVKSLINLNETFHQDPVRMIRALKYSTTTGFQINSDLKKAIKRDSKLISNCPVSRMVEEVFKILSTGYSQIIIEQCIKYKIFPFMLSEINNKIQKNRHLKKMFMQKLKQIDKRIQKGQEITRSMQIEALVALFIEIDKSIVLKKELFNSCFKQIKKIIAPLTPPNVDVEKATVGILKDHGIVIKRIFGQKRRTNYRKRK